MFAGTFEVLRSVYWNIAKVSTFTSWIFALYFPSSSLQEIVILIGMIAEALRRWTNCFAANSFSIVPTCIQSIFRYLRIVLLVILKLLFSHKNSSIVSHKIAVFYILIHVFSTADISSGFSYLHPVDIVYNPSDYAYNDQYLNNQYMMKRLSGYKSILEATAGKQTLS